MRSSISLDQEVPEILCSGTSHGYGIFVSAVCVCTGML